MGGIDSARTRAAAVRQSSSGRRQWEEKTRCSTQRSASA